MSDNNRLKTHVSLFLQDFSGRVKGFKVDAIDTTGAGDAFVAGILSQLAVDISLLQVGKMFSLINQSIYQNTF